MGERIDYIVLKLNSLPKPERRKSREPLHAHGNQKARKLVF